MSPIWMERTYLLPLSRRVVSVRPAVRALRSGEKHRMDPRVCFAPGRVASLLHQRRSAAVSAGIAPFDVEVVT